VLNLEGLEVQAPMMVGEVPKCRYGHSSVLIGLTLVVFGGICDHAPSNELFLLNTATLRWCAFPLLPMLVRLMLPSALPIVPPPALLCPSSAVAILVITEGKSPCTRVTGYYTTSVVGFYTTATLLV
jgi:hypothetical protein